MLQVRKSHFCVISAIFSSVVFLHFSCYTLMTFLMMSSLELASELESDLQDTVD